MDVLNDLADMMARGKRCEVARDIARVLTDDLQSKLEAMIPSSEARENFQTVRRRLKRAERFDSSEQLLAALCGTAESAETLRVMLDCLGTERFIALFVQSRKQ